MSILLGGLGSIVVCVVLVCYWGRRQEARMRYIYKMVLMRRYGFTEQRAEQWLQDLNI